MQDFGRPMSGQTLAESMHQGQIVPCDVEANCGPLQWELGSQCHNPVALAMVLSQALLVIKSRPSHSRLSQNAWISFLHTFRAESNVLLLHCNGLPAGR